MCCFFGKCIPCFHLFQSFSFIDDSNQGSPSSDISGLVAEPNLSGRSHTLIFSSSEVSALLVAHSSLQDDSCAAKRARSQACFLSLPPFVAEICECWGRRRKMHVCVFAFEAVVCYGNMFSGLAFVEFVHCTTPGALTSFGRPQNDVDALLLLSGVPVSVFVLMLWCLAVCETQPFTHTVSHKHKHTHRPASENLGVLHIYIWETLILESSCCVL